MPDKRPTAGRKVSESQPKAVVSVSEMARLCGLSRARFYELLGKGFFPAPKRAPTTKRPYFDREGQDACLGVRGTNMGVNGEPILFYTVRVPRPERATPQRAERTGRSSRSVPADSRIGALVDGLRQLGLDSATEAAVQTAIRTTFPEGIASLDDAALLPPLFRLLRSQRATN